MGTGSYNYEQEFEEINFSSSRLRSRFIKTMVELKEQPGKSIWLSSGSRSEAKAVYRMLGNEKLKDQKILRCHRSATIERISDNQVILAVQDTTGVNYANHAKM